MKIGCGAVAALVVLVAIIAIATAGGSKGSTPTTNTPATQPVQQNQPTQAPTKPQPTPTQVGNVIGNPIVADSTWTVTLNSISTSQGDQFNVPKSGDIFIVLNVTLLNTSSQGGEVRFLYCDLQHILMRLCNHM